ncbi:DNA repair protein [Cryphonectria parasitica EP155]|uniref:DNA repair protein RAD14 n=1 Tax=Cryphonectria parasitica (strain ATCC 38755 / EP155) TaxID=660469 RepID=A0A9P4Y4L9_CRYP1|nr:DNA repair protein [Cryphonectria parasitica EP155]KAF3766436.1 DNA repair protein [Cryphonectria parasitica EP155]
MERPSTPPPPLNRTSNKAVNASPPTPEVTRKLEESRLRAKDLRTQKEAHARSTGTEPTIAKTSSGFVNTPDIQVVGAGTRQQPRNNKRPYESITQSEVPASNRDGRPPAKKDVAAEDGALRPASKKFARFVDYNFSAMTDTKGGFLSAEDDPWNKSMSIGGPSRGGDGGGPDEEQKPKHMTAAEWERLQLLRKLQRQKAGPFEPGLSALTDKKERKTCRECGSLEIDFVWDEVFNCRVCNACKEKFPDKYSLLTKTECKEDYLITDSELRDEDLLPHLSKPNPHKSHWHDMMLFLRFQVEEYAFNTKWGSAEALDAEFEKRETNKKKQKDKKFKERLFELKRKTRTEAMRRAAGGGSSAQKFGDEIGRSGRHVHEWGRAIENEDGESVKTCVSCGMEVEELEF